MLVDGKISFAQDIGGVQQKAGLRHGIMARLARSTWGLETGLFRATHSTLLTSLMRYGMRVVDSGAREKASGEMGARSINVSARRITGISRSARLEVLFMAAGSWSVQNQ